jgi:hypothetical protein
MRRIVARFLIRGAVCVDPRIRAGRVACIALACGSLGCVGLAVGASSTIAYSGHAAVASLSAKQFYARSQAAMAAYEGIAFTGGGTSYEIVPQAGVNNFRFDFGETPAGYTKAVDKVTVVAHGGTVVEEIDTLSAAGLPRLRLWRVAGEFVGEVLVAHACALLIPKTNAGFVAVGRSFVALGGYHFAKLGTPANRPGVRIVRSTYPLAGGTAHETDTIAASSFLWQAQKLVVRGGPFSGASLSESRFRYSRTRKISTPPLVGRCA